MAEINDLIEDNRKLKIEMTDGVLVPERDETSIFSAWRIAFFGAIILLLGLTCISPGNLKRIHLFLVNSTGGSITIATYKTIAADTFKEKLLPALKNGKDRTLVTESYRENTADNTYVLSEKIDPEEKAKLYSIISGTKTIDNFAEIDKAYFTGHILNKITGRDRKMRFQHFYQLDLSGRFYEIDTTISSRDAAFILDTIYAAIYVNPYAEALMFVPDGIITTFEVTALAIIFASMIGLLVGLGRISRIPLINRIATIYVEIIRGIPLLVQLFYIYYAIAKIVNIEGIAAAVIAMSICYGAYIGEIFRAGIQSIHKGQMEAALALGMTRAQAIVKIILPQTFKVVLPPIGNEFIALLKDSSLVSILAVADLLRRGREYASKTFFYFETFTIVALIYLVLTLFFSRLVGMMEENLKKKG